MDQVTITSHWEVSIQEFDVDSIRKYKVTRKMRDHYYAESKTFTSKDQAVRQFDDWIE